MGLDREETSQKLGKQAFEQRYRTLVERIPAIVYIHEPVSDHQSTGQPVTYDYEVSYVSPQVERILGYKPEEFLKERALWNEIIHPEDLAEVAAEDERTDTAGERFSMEYRMFHRDGRVVWVRDEAELICGPEDEPLYWQGVMTDVTERRQDRDALRESEERFRSVFENASTGVALVGLDNRYLKANHALCEMIGYPEEELLSKRSFDLTHPDDQMKSRARTRRILEGDGPETERLEKRYLTKNGAVVWAISDTSLVRDSERNPSHFVSHLQDITERKRLEERLSYQAHHDPLTGLSNRNELQERFGRIARRPVARPHEPPDDFSGGAPYVGVLFMDLDGFKGINDSFGHATGDRLLQAAAERLAVGVRNGDTAARLGGDEFCVLLAGISGTTEAVQIAKRLKASLEAPFSIGSNSSMVSLTASIGIAVGRPEDDRPLDELLREADAAMYRAKKRGGALYEVIELEEESAG